MTAKERYNSLIDKIEEDARNCYIKAPDVVSRVARSEGISTQDLNAVIKFMTGYTALNYVKERKLMASYRYLIETKDPRNRDLAELAGYSDDQALSKGFKKRFGMPPGKALRKKGRCLLKRPMTWEVISGEISIFEEQLEGGANDV